MKSDFEKEYNRLREEKRQLLIDNRDKQLELDAILNSKAWRMLDFSRKMKAKVQDMVIGPKNAAKRLVKGAELPMVNTYDSYFEENEELAEGDTTDIKAIAFYALSSEPNTKAEARFQGHYQPRDYLDGRMTMTKEVALAKQHGIYGFCFECFDSEAIRKVREDFVAKEKIDFKFLVYIRDLDAVKEVREIIKDKRYIKVDGKAIVLVDRMEGETKVPSGVVVWAKSKIVAGRATGAAAEFDFLPEVAEDEEIVTGEKEVDEKNDGQKVYDYGKMLIRAQEDGLYADHLSARPFYYTCAIGMDDSGVTEDYTIYAGFSPRVFYNWLRLVIGETRRKNPEDKRFVFVNAWNDWARGMCLVPDKKHGFTNLNTLTRAIYDLPFEKDVVILDKKSPAAEKISGKIALQVHVFYPEILPEIISQISKIPYKFDLYISTNEETKRRIIEDEIKVAKINYDNLTIEVVENQGRDVYPFIKQINPVYKDYAYVGHIHTKKTVEHGFGDDWRKYLYDQLFGSSKNIQQIFRILESKGTGLVFPEIYEKVSHAVGIGNNTRVVNKLLKRMGLPRMQKEETVEFAAGTMFWAKMEAIEKIFEMQLTGEDFPPEVGQIDGTTAHALERLFGIVPKKLGYKLVQTLNRDLG